MNIESIFKNLKKTAIDNSPLILTYLSVAGVLSTTILAVKATPKALKSLETATKVDNLGEKLSPKQVVKYTWRHYTPAAMSGIFTISCIVGANHISARRNAAIMTVYTIAETTLKEYQAKVKEHVGDVKAKQFKDDIVKEHLLDTPMATSQVHITGMGETLCYDSFTGRYFKSDMEAIRRAQNDINAKIISDMYASHNDFYALIGLERTKYGEELGWNVDNLLDIEFSSHLASDGKPCLCLEYVSSPVRNYHKFG
jgi:hypothetical protein